MAAMRAGVVATFVLACAVFGLTTGLAALWLADGRWQGLVAAVEAIAAGVLAVVTFELQEMVGEMAS